MASSLTSRTLTPTGALSPPDRFPPAAPGAARPPGAPHADCPHPPRVHGVEEGRAQGPAEMQFELIRHLNEPE